MTDADTLAHEVDRLRAQIAILEEQVAYWKNLVDTSNALIVDSAADGSVLYLNSTAQRVFQTTLQESVGTSLFAVIVEEDRERVRQAFYEAIRLRSTHLTLQCRVQSPRGSEFQGLWSIVLRYDADGNYAGASATAYDVGPVRQARREAEASREMLQLVIDSLPQAVFWKDRDSRYLGANRRLLADAGLNSLDEIVGKTDDELPWAEQAPLYQADDRAVMEHGPKLRIEEPLTRADGSRIWLRTDKLPLMRDGEVIGVLAIYEDVTEAQQRLAELRIFKALVDNASDGIIVADPNSQIVYANAAMAAMLGYPSLTGMDAMQIVHPDSLSQLSVLTRSVLQGTKVNQEFRYCHRDGSTVVMNTSGIAIFNEQGQPIAFASINRDLSEQLYLEEQRRRMQEQIIEAQQALLRELSTPLLPIADQVIAMPIVGSIDSNRAMQIMETLLEGVARFAAQTAILDIIGVQIVDTQVAGALIRAAQAAKLLGAQVIITGISPEVAQTLVSIGTELTGMVSKPNLQEGIAFALRRRNGNAGARKL